MSMTSRMRLGFGVLASVALSTAMLWPVVDARQQKPVVPTTSTAPPAGQTETRLADGRVLLLGGTGAEGAVGAAVLVDPSSGTRTPLPVSMTAPRTAHTATLLPDGTVLIIGGRGRSGQMVQIAELFDPDTGQFLPMGVAGAIPRAGHTATVLTDGRVLVAGGATDGDQLLGQVEIWDVPHQEATTLPDSLHRTRTGQTATLMADGRVLVAGGVDADGQRIRNAEVIDATRQRILDATPPADDQAPARIADSLPANGSTDVPVDIRIALRFSKPLRSETVNDRSVTLASQEGRVDATVVAAEGGRLLFVTPRTPLQADTPHTVALVGASDIAGAFVTAGPLRFVTARDVRTVPDVTDAEGWTPDATREGGWRTNRPNSPWQAMPPLQAAAGVTAVAGQVLRLDGQPLPGVTLTIEGHTATSDRTGRFLLLAAGLGTGEHTLAIDGATANRGRRTYGFYEARITLKAGVTTALPFTIWSPVLDTAHTITIASPTSTETVVTTPTMPGLELHLPAGTIIRDEAGKIVRQLTMTPIPLDRPPFPLPPDATFTMDFTIQPGGAYVSTPGPIKGAWIVYPNIAHSRVGKRVQFFNYDPDDKGWFVYGMGTVGETQVRPDAKTRLYAFTGASFNDGNTAPNKGPTPPPAPRGEPMDPSTGVYSMQKTDLYLPDVIPLALTRNYNSMDPNPRPFGYGMTHAYAIFQHSEHQFDEADLILPDGGKIHYVRVSADGLPWYSTVLECQTAPTEFYKSRIMFDGNSWNLTRTDGTTYVFGHAASLQKIRDRYGNEVRLTWSSTNVFGAGTGNLLRITSPNGRWISLTYDTSNRITQATDNIGRTLSYTYDANGNLSTVTDPENNVTTYKYDASHRLLTIKDGRGIVYLTNQYDTSGRVSRQALADPTAVYQFTYTADGSGNITQTDITDPMGHVERLSFNATHRIVSDTEAYATSLARTTTIERQAGTDFVTATVDGLNRRTAYTYDSAGHLLTVTRLAGTSDAVTTTYTYESQFGDLASVTDPLNHTLTLGYDSLGRLISVTDPLTHSTTMTRNASGQLVSVTNALQHTWQFAYSGGDLTSVTDPTNAVRRRFLDGAGRLVAVTDPLGRQTRFGLDKLDRVTLVTDAVGDQTSFSYDPNSNLLSMTDALTHSTVYTYDAVDRVATRTDSLQKMGTFQYDRNDNLTQSTDRKNQITSYQYDELDRRIQVTYPDASTTQYIYDAGDRITQIADSVAGSTTRGYDLLDRLTSESTPEGTVSYTYDAAGRRASMTVAGQASISYGYDNANRLTSITQGSAAIAFSYDSGNHRNTVTYPNGIVATYSFDGANRLINVSYASGQTTLGDLGYTYDVSGQPTNVNGSWARTALPQALSSISVDAANRISTWGAASFSYDLNGNLTSDGVTAYTWNTRNQLIGLSDGASANFAYDGVGRRRSKTINGATTKFLYDGVNFVQELSAGGTVTANVLAGLEIDEAFSRTDSTGTSARLVDALGSTLALADSFGSVQTQYTFEPFGTAASSGTVSTNAQGFTGREDDITGLYFYRARYYSPGVSRFLSEDPLNDSARIRNLLRSRDVTSSYAYAQNDPLKWKDPEGMAPGQVHLAP
jgi:RHS repeat-associated protein